MKTNCSQPAFPTFSHYPNLFAGRWSLQPRGFKMWLFTTAVSNMMHMASNQLAGNQIPLQCQLDPQLIRLNLLQFYFICLQTPQSQSHWLLITLSEKKNAKGVGDGERLDFNLLDGWSGWINLRNEEAGLLLEQPYLRAGHPTLSECLTCNHRDYQEFGSKIGTAGFTATDDTNVLDWMVTFHDCACFALVFFCLFDFFFFYYSNKVM